MALPVMERPVASAPAEVPHRAGIQALLAGATLEVTPRDAAEIEGCGEHLAAGSEVFISMPSGQTYHAALALAVRLRRAGFVPVPHVVARGFASQDALEDYLARAAGEAGVDRVLLLGGDRDRPAGPFESSASLLRTGLLSRIGIRRIGIAGYPEGHPRISADVLEKALQAKKRLARDQGLDLHLLTQFCFDAPPLLAFACRMRNQGLPVRVGLAGPASITTLLKFAARCGIGNSVRVLTSHGESLIRLLTEAGPERLVSELAGAAGGDPGLPLSGLHFFTFGGLQRTARWIHAVREGNFELDAHAGFRAGKAR